MEGLIVSFGARGSVRGKWPLDRQTFPKRYQLVTFWGYKLGSKRPFSIPEELDLAKFDIVLRKIEGKTVHTL